MTTLLLVRHGHTDVAGRRLTGWQPGVHLNARGREEAERLVERLDGVPVDAIVTSPLERARETAAPLARARRLRPVTERGLIEVDYGEWTGRSIAQLRRTRLWRNVIRAPSTFRFPGGESLLEVQTRAVDAAVAIAAAHPSGTVVAFSHADPIRLLVAHLSGMHADHLQRLVIDTASVTAIALGQDVPRIVKVNDTGDLSALVPPRPRPRRKVGG
ncbi:MAG TPA: MSMEG_4193 family putative phosphomutase [Actinomycetota bacterium]|jgi:probable phosphoglycerate mutase|nr:MSMEG_4193 family putative phosphomutase [Actinomycetota bacterium]